MTTPVGGAGIGPAGPTGPQRGDSRRIPLEELGGGGRKSFADTLKQALGDVSDLQTDARDAIGAFLRGEPIELHQVMAATEEAGIALETLIQIRNKLTEAYRTVINMQN